MAYVRPWAEVGNLLGTRDSDEIDDAVREFRADLAERFAALVVDVEADPWVPKITIPLVNRYHWSIGNLATANPATRGTYLTPTNATGAGSIQLLVPVHVPVGFSLTGLKFKLKNTAAGCQIDVIAQKLDAAGVATGLGTPITALATVSDWTDRDLGTIDALCSAGDSFVALVSLANGATPQTCQFMDFEVTMTAPEV